MDLELPARTWRQRRWGGLRPEVEVRWAFGPREEHVPTARLALRGHGDDSARVDRLHLGGFGGGAAFGADYRAGHGVAFGASYALGLHTGIQRASDSNTTSTWGVPEASFRVQFEL